MSQLYYYYCYDYCYYYYYYWGKEVYIEESQCCSGCVCCCRSRFLLHFKWILWESDLFCQLIWLLFVVFFFFFTVKENLWIWAHSAVWRHTFKFNSEASVLLHQDLNFCFYWNYICSKAILCVYMGVCVCVCVMSKVLSSRHRHPDVSPLKRQSRGNKHLQPSNRTKTNISHRPWRLLNYPAYFLLLLPKTSSSSFFFFSHSSSCER